MRATQKSVVRSENDDGVFRNACCSESVTYHAHGHVDGVDLLVVFGHHLVVAGAVPPAFKPFILPPQTALWREMLSILATKVSWFGEFRSGVYVIETRVGRYRMMWGLEADGKAEWPLTLRGIVDEVPPERAVRKC